MKKSIKHHALLVAFSSVLAVSSASAANSFYSSGDLVLYFQKTSGTGSTNVVYANLGNAATDFRGAATGADAANKIQFLDLSSTLISAFGSGWATDPSVYAGLAGVYSASTNLTQSYNLDPNRTVYVSAARTSVGTIGVKSSGGYTIGSNNTMNTFSSAILTQNEAFADADGANGYNASVIISNSDTAVNVSQIGTMNPIGAGLNGFNGSITGTSMQSADAATFGTIDGVGSTAFALDLYRIEAVNNIAGQVGQGQTVRRGTFEGTVALGTDGQVSFMTSPVPEPSALTLSGLAAGALVLRRRRRSA